MEGFEPGAECAECGGRCCREKGCSLSPADMARALRAVGAAKVLDTDSGAIGSVCRDQLLSLLTDPGRGLYAIDFMNGAQGPVYYLRMRHKCYTFIGVDAIGECTALSEDGCLLSFTERPRGGRELESHPDLHCVQHYEREEMLRDWEPYQELLASIWEEYHRQFTEDGTFEKCDEAYFAWLRERRESGAR